MGVEAALSVLGKGAIPACGEVRIVILREDML